MTGEEKLRGLLWYAWHEFNAIRARSGAPLDHYGMTMVSHEWWDVMTEAFAEAIGHDARTPWPSEEAKAAILAAPEGVERMSDDLDEAITLALDRVSDFPGPTCPDIDTLLRDHAPVRRLADKLMRQNAADRDPAELNELVELADGFHWGDFEDSLEDLRRSNEALRSALHEALEHKKQIAAILHTVRQSAP